MLSRYILAAALSLILAISAGIDFGLMVGLAIALPALAATFGLYFWFWKTGSHASWVYKID